MSGPVIFVITTFIITAFMLYEGKEIDQIFLYLLLSNLVLAVLLGYSLINVIGSH